jgi:hypothetical protein
MLRLPIRVSATEASELISGAAHLSDDQPSLIHSTASTGYSVPEHIVPTLSSMP